MDKPTEARSRLPPQTINKMRSLNTEHLRLYANDLLSSYDGRARKLNVVGKRMAQEWVVNQAVFLNEIAEELRRIILSGEAP